MQQGIIGWDIGGAHIKAAVLETNGKFSKVLQLPCPLWKGIEFLNKAVSQILAEAPDYDCIHAITMTGELVDLFESRGQGVETIIQTMQAALPNEKLFIYTGLDGLAKSDQIQNYYYSSIASSNWLASASLVATQINNGLFIDIGSTTTDILILANQKVQAIGFTDYERLISDELVYTGIIRTAVMAVAQSANFRGQNMGLMAEYFATMADVYRLTGELNEAHDQTDTADGAEKSAFASAKRLSRMTGFEYLETDLSLWKKFAENIKQQQKNNILKACEKQLSRNLILTEDYIVGAGVGRFLVKQIAASLGHPYIDFNELYKDNIQHSGIDMADCVPAVSVALLLAST